ncbi:MAG: methionine--tRNA ligase [Dehalococcoidia bacterium]|nr:methionine--tRNA ligase [Dehalococcoidia bacterium]
MPEKIFIGVAWPYANGSLHLGQIAGAYLPPDIFARYHRVKGNRVLMVSGSDQHGTPITVRAAEEGVSPTEIASRFHEEFVDSWRRLGIAFDLYTTTGTANHAAVVQDMFSRLLQNGDIYREKMRLPYCTVEQRFLLDRYVIGVCPICGYPDARGDQCDNCGNVLDPNDLLDAHCRFDGSVPETRESEHFFLRLSAYNERLKAWLSEDKAHWRKNVLNFSLGVLQQGLRDRAITRDLEWGIKIPVEGFEDKRIYVWFENVIGYLSAAKEWAQRRGEPEAWREFWQDPECKSYYFIGKDNIWFHTLSWPAMLMMYGGLNLPYDVPANQYLNFGGGKASTSRGTAPFLPDYLAKYDPDPLRYYLTAIMPETADSDFSEVALVRRNNDELLATWGNLVHRVVTFTYRRFDGKVPEPGYLDAESRALLSRAETALQEEGDHLAACRFRAGLASAMSLAQDANRYLEEKSPWRRIKEDPLEAATALHTAISVINTLKTAFYPYLPFTSERLHGYLGQEGDVTAAGWQVRAVEPGTPLREPEPLFKKLEPLVTEEEEAPPA